jgi:predicted N-formylglutamate amidohydrolase
MGQSLLRGEDGPAIVLNETGTSPVVLISEHAGNRIPGSLGSLGLGEAELKRHIAWDIGVEPLVRRLSNLLDAPAVLQRYSRLVYDCNRPPEETSAVPEISETTRIPGNQGLTADERRARAEALYEPFHARIAELLDARQRRGMATIFITVHSFTPVFKGMARPLHVGLVFDRDRRFTDMLKPLLDRERKWDVRLNKPYGPQDGVCHTLHLHPEPRRLPYAMIEIRNDLIAAPQGQAQWADRLSTVLRQAAAIGDSSTALKTVRASA